MPDTIPLTRAALCELDSRGDELVSVRVFTVAGSDGCSNASVYSTAPR